MKSEFNNSKLISIVIYRLGFFLAKETFSHHFSGKSIKTFVWFVIYRSKETPVKNKHFTHWKSPVKLAIQMNTRCIEASALRATWNSNAPINNNGNLVYLWWIIQPSWSTATPCCIFHICFFNLLKINKHEVHLMRTLFIDW